MDEIDTETAKKKKSGRIMMIGAIAVVSLLGAGGGWLLGGFLAPAPLTTEEARVLEEAKATIKAREAAEAAPEAAAGGEHGGAKKEDEGSLPKASTEANGVLQLDPITTNLSYPAEKWIRIELALLFKGPPDAPMAHAIQEDIAAYLHTVSLQQIEGPRGFQYLKDDIQERVDLRSEGRVTNVIFRTFVVQ